MAGSLASIKNPYPAQGGDPERLLQAFLRTANELRGTIETLEACWQEAIQAACFPATEFRSYLNLMQSRNYPAVHHSQVFTETYRPAYRVVCCRFLDIC